MTEQGLLSALQAVADSNQYTYNICGVARFLNTQKDGERQNYEEILDNPNIMASRLSKIFFDNGHKVTAYMIRYHRNRLEGRGCKCPINQ